MFDDLEPVFDDLEPKLRMIMANMSAGLYWTSEFTGWQLGLSHWILPWSRFL